MPLTSINIYTLKQIRTKRHRYDLEDYPITTPYSPAEARRRREKIKTGSINVYCQIVIFHKFYNDC